ncbi:hypothetical protein EYF80_061543 [Liparis tanakae]|uniref:Uncharacterized protein n=1 Tax=Liparis tanakae TaxID=230148 RepID=A0A4Z2EHL3_9TELE|nr:hypothetical protein EYF80_061543 [Liparis tanakae]
MTSYFSRCAGMELSCELSTERAVNGAMLDEHALTSTPPVDNARRH